MRHINLGARCFKALLAFIFTAEAASADFSCPDASAIDLYPLANKYVSGDSVEARAAPFIHVIENAARAMDKPALDRACFSLAYLLAQPLRTCSAGECSQLSYEQLLETKARNSALDRCPARALYRDPVLPIRRHHVVPTNTMIEEKITGWVSFDLAVSKTGSVTSAKIRESTNTALNEASTKAAHKFRYQPVEPATDRIVSATVSTTY
jgi:hypothetical protein